MNASAELMVMLLRDTPNLPGARCTRPGVREFFDAAMLPAAT